jgi:hypothetical protein
VAKWVQKIFNCKCGKKIIRLLAIPDELSIIEYPCECGKLAKRTDISFKTSSKQIMDSVHAEQGVRVFEKGKRKILGTMREVKEYAKRNNCTFGSDDTEREAEIQRDNKDKAYVRDTTEKIINDFERLQRQKIARAR